MLIPSGARHLSSLKISRALSRGSADCVEGLSCLLGVEEVGIRDLLGIADLGADDGHEVGVELLGVSHELHPGWESITGSVSSSCCGSS